jgi:hypothetical protein
LVRKSDQWILLAHRSGNRYKPSWGETFSPQTSRMRSNNPGFNAAFFDVDRANAFSFGPSQPDPQNRLEHNTKKPLRNEGTDY